MKVPVNLNTKKVVILDTSTFCVWLKVPGFDTCGSDDDKWDFSRVDAKIQAEIAANNTLVLPLATIIETGNHISQCNGDPFNIAKEFCEVLVKSIDSLHPWAAFSEQSILWNNDNTKALASSWPKKAAQRISIGDATIIYIAEYYNKARWQVEILTGDAGLKSFEPAPESQETPPTIEPRRRK